MKLTIYIFFILTISLSCNREQRQLEALVEDVLPGEWNILSFEMKGVCKSLEANIIYPPDTILYDLGTMFFPEFEMDTLSLNGGGGGVGIDSHISAFGHMETFKIERLITIDDDTSMAYFRTKGNGLFQETDDLTDFIEFSSLFWQNMYLKMENKNLITLTSTSGEMIVITLART